MGEMVFDDLCVMAERDIVAPSVASALREAMLVELAEVPEEWPDGADEVLKLFRLPSPVVALGGEASCVLICEDGAVGLETSRTILECQPLGPGRDVVKFKEGSSQAQWDHLQKASQLPRAAYAFSASRVGKAKFSEEPGKVFEFGGAFVATQIVSKNRVLRTAKEYQRDAATSGTFGVHARSAVQSAVEALNQIALLVAHGFRCEKVAEPAVPSTRKEKAFIRRSHHRPRYRYVKD